MSAHNDTVLPPEDSALLKGNAYVRSHEIYKSIAATEDAGMANGARWLARDAYQSGFFEGKRAAEAKLAEVERQRDEEVKSLTSQLKKCIDTKQRSLL